MSNASATPKGHGPATHRVIEPPVDLRSRVRVIGKGSLEEDAIRKAEHVLHQLSAQFDTWMDQELLKLAASRDRARREGLAGEAGEALFTAAHDIKGEAATLGFPLAGAVAARLCELLLAGPRAQLPFRLIDLHVDAVRAIVHQGVRNAEHPLASTLVRELSGATAALLKRMAGTAEAGATPPDQDSPDQDSAASP